MNEKEKSYYPLVKQQVTELFESKGCKVYLEITANKKFSNKIKGKIPDHRQIIFSFLNNVAPDITGFIEKGSLTDFVIIEIKKEKIKLYHIYQARKYAELFEAKLAFLVSTKQIPEEIKRLSKVTHPLLNRESMYQSLTLVHFDKETESLEDWYSENPFEKDYHWL